MNNLKKSILTSLALFLCSSLLATDANLDCDHHRSHHHRSQHCNQELRVYGSFYSTFQNAPEPFPVVINPGEFVPFTNAAAHQGIQVNLGSTEFTVTEDGDYWIEFGVGSAGEAFGNLAAQLYINNNPVADGIARISDTRASLSRLGLFLRLLAGDVVNVRNVSPGVLFWGPVATSTLPLVPAISSSLTIERVHDITPAPLR